MEWQNKWADATKLKLGLMHSYYVSRDKEMNVSICNGLKHVKVYLIHDIKHDSGHHPRLVANGHFTKS